MGPSDRESGIRVLGGLRSSCAAIVVVPVTFEGMTAVDLTSGKAVSHARSDGDRSLRPLLTPPRFIFRQLKPIIQPSKSARILLLSLSLAFALSGNSLPVQATLTAIHINYFRFGYMIVGMVSY